MGRRESFTVGELNITERIIQAIPSGETMLYVSKFGDNTRGNGVANSPLATLAAAAALVTDTRKIIKIDAGDYSAEADITWPNINGLVISGNGGDVILPPVTINPTYTTTTFEAYLKHVTIKHTAEVGLSINNTHMTRKLLIGLDDVSFEQVSTGNSITIVHATAGQAIRLYAKNCQEIEGLVGWACANVDDRFRFKNCELSGGVAGTGAVAGEVSFINCGLLTGTFSVDAAQVITYIGSYWRTDAGVYTELANAFSG